MKHLYRFLFVIFIFPAIGYSQTRDTSAVHFFIDAGVNSSSTKISGSDQLSGSKASSSLYPELTIGANIYFDKSTQNVVFKPALSFTGTKGAFAVDGNSGTPYTIDYNYKQTMISLSAMVADNLVNQKNFRFYLAIGGAMNYGLYSGVDHTITYHVTPGNTTSSTSPLDPIATANIFFNGAVKAGFEFNRQFEVYALYTPSYSFTNYATMSVATSSFRAGIGYLFGGNK